MKNLFLKLNGIQTHSMIWGDPFNSHGNDVIICITGNPGLPDFYEEFATQMYKNSGLPVCIIGHAGHVEVPDVNSNKLNGQENLFNLQGQLKHKFELLKLIDKKSKLHLIGHSIGAWMILEMIEQDITFIERVATVNLLFPTLQRMAETRNGIFLNNILRRINYVVILFITLLNSIPEFIRIFLVGLYLKLFSLPKHYTQRILKYINQNVIEKVLFLAYDEMDCVRSLNEKALERIKHLTYVVYSTCDGWAPLQYMEDLKKFQPDICLHKVNIEHAFVLKASEEVSDIVSEFIMKKVTITDK